jgi:hypothetical protein
MDLRSAQGVSQTAVALSAGRSSQTIKLCAAMQAYTRLLFDFSEALRALVDNSHATANDKEKYAGKHAEWEGDEAAYYTDGLNCCTSPDELRFPDFVSHDSFMALCTTWSRLTNALNSPTIRRVICSLHRGFWKVTGRFIAVCLLVLPIASCNKSAYDRLVGVWKYENQGDTIIFVFRSDGSLVMTDANAQKSNDQFGRWAMEDSAVIKVELDDGMPGKWSVISLGKDELIIRPEQSSSRVFSFKLVSDTPQAPTETEKFARTPEGRKRRHDEWWIPMVSKAVFNNARQLSAAADQYYLENGVTTVGLNDLVGATNYVKAINTVANEIYPSTYTQGITITIGGVAGVRTITYSP